uniref:Putative ATPase domain containing protein n=1 Tax=viral metagenome TaxID=1070528 RepID=A0A6M3IMF3_9ZZZZ
MIKSITLKNFQSHVDTILELDDGVNIVQGQSDSGKSSVIRALLWLATNRPSGDAFRRHGKKKVSVSVVLDSGEMVERLKEKSSNGYTLDGKSYEATGTEVPETICNLLNLNDVNVQWQMDAPFLLSESSGEVARQLNKVADLEKIDTALANVNRMIRDNKEKLLSEAQRKISLEGELSRFAGVDALEKTVERLKELDAKVFSIVKSAQDILQLTTKMRGTKERMSSLPDTETASTLLDITLKKTTAHDEKTSEAARMSTLSARITSLLARMGSLPSVDRLIPILEGAVKKLDESRTLESRINAIKRTAGDVRRKAGIVDGKVETERGLEKRWKKEFPSECPLCGQEMKHAR